MNLDRYEFNEDKASASFYFESYGPKGVIKKVIKYKEITILPNGMPVFNLSFGDWNEQLQKADDLIISNNKDREKVLATVASTILYFLEARSSKAAVFAKGSTPAKTRLYQMGINANKKEIEAMFEVYGLYNETFVKFEHGCNYEAFLVIKK